MTIRILFREPAVLFDLGNTPAAYYRSDQFQPILETAINAVLEELKSRIIPTVSAEMAIQSATAENREAPDGQFSPQAARLERVFEIPLAADTLDRKLSQTDYAERRIEDLQGLLQLFEADA
jgi:hypothetical protein